MKTAYLLLAIAAASAKQFDKCTQDAECGTGMFCKPSDDKTFSMCQPTEAKGDGKQYSKCKSNSECVEGFFCKPTNDKAFSMCQPNESCAKKWSQCGGSSFVGTSCCEDGSVCKTWASFYSQCVPKSWKQDAEATCTNVSVEGDATYCANGPICGGQGTSCPKKGDVAVADCLKALTSYVGANAKCVAPEDASCKKLKTGAFGCVWASNEPKKDAEAAEAGCTNVSVVGDATFCVQGAICGGNGDACPKKGDVASQDCLKTLNSYVDAAKCVAPIDAVCQQLPSGARGCVFGAVSATTAAPGTPTATPVVTPATTTSGQCSTNWSQCNGQNWPFGVCCQDPKFQCNKKNDYLSLCEPKDGNKRNVEATAVYQQCGGKEFKGNTACAAGNKCTWINDYYSQCQPDKNESGLPTYAQCGGKEYHGANACRSEDKCVKYNDFYSQCVPATHTRGKGGSKE